jgi:hypothetical protein
MPLLGADPLLVDASAHPATRAGRPWTPFLGRIDGRGAVPWLAFDHPAFGSARPLPLVLRIPVDEASWSPGDVGRRVKSRSFHDLPPFAVNLAVGTARPRPFWGAPYVNPARTWFNCWYGLVQVDVARETWGRPFGYASTDGNPEPAELARLAKACWLWFANFLYGVKESVVAASDGEDLLVKHGVGRPETLAPGRSWDRVSLRGLTTVGAYRSDEDFQYLEPNDPFVSMPLRVWLGLSTWQPVSPVSFPRESMAIEAWTTWWEDPARGAYCTLIAGGSRREGHAEGSALMEAQLAAVRRVLVERFGGRGFAR